MRSRRSVVGAGVAVLLAFGLLGGPAGPAGAAVHRIGFLADTSFECASGEILLGVPDADFGWVVLQQRRERVSAVVAIRDAAPRTSYVIRLVQITPDGTDCHADPRTVVTNGVGRATVRLVEDLRPDATGFNVAVDTGTLFATPNWVTDQTVPRSP